VIPFAGTDIHLEKIKVKDGSQNKEN